MKTYSRERGQALILFALGLVTLLGFTALAVDGSLIYSDRRQVQNVVDATSLAGAGAAGSYLIDNDVRAGNWDCVGGVAVSGGHADKAMKQARNTAIIMANDKYNQTITEDLLATENYVRTHCENDYIDVLVTITFETQTSLVHFVYQGQVKNTVIAVSRVYISAPVGTGGSLISLSDSCDNKKGIRFSGGGKSEDLGSEDDETAEADILLIGGGAYSNSCVWAEGRVHVRAEDENGNISEGSILYVDQKEIGANATVEPDPDQTSEKMAIVIPPPKCTSATYTSAPGSGTLSPGNYTGISASGPDLILEPGLYCLTNDFKITGGTVTGDGVTIYLKNGGFNVSGNPTIQMSAPAVGCESTDPTLDGCPPAVGGLLIYLDPTNNSNVELEGTTGSNYSGTVYAPAPGSIIKIGGTTKTESLDAGVQAIGYTIRVHGNGSLKLTYDEGSLYHTPTKLDLYR